MAESKPGENHFYTVRNANYKKPRAEASSGLSRRQIRQGRQGRVIDMPTRISKVNASSSP